MISDTEKICVYPFWHAEIDYDGNVSCCCPDYTDFYFFGNIFKQPFQEIWNGKKWINFRKNIKSCNYKKCNLDMCMGLDDTQFVNTLPRGFDINPKGPRFVTLSLDSSCNVRCIFCRDKKHFMYKKDLEKIMGMIDDYFIPMLENVEIVTLNGAGELFASKFCKQLIQKATEKYKQIKFDIFTNGLLCNEKNLKIFGLRNRINMVTVSIHAASEETYNKIIQYSDFNKVMANCKYLSELKKSGEINDFALTFVVTSLNYHEIPDFIELAVSLDAYPNIWPVRPFNDCQVCKEIDRYDITKKLHPEHKKFLEILKSPVLKKYHTLTNGQITSLFEE